MIRVTVPSLAKLNLDLRVLHKRPDGYHELRTIFQTISLGDRLTIDFEIAKRTQIELDSSVDIQNNLVVRSAKMVLEHLKLNAWVRFVLRKRIPMGAGLGGGSSNAASVLAALPALAGRRLEAGELSNLGESLGSDVPFFLLGGTVLGLGTGTELYPLPGLPSHPLLVVSTGVHVSTAEAYQVLNRSLPDAFKSNVTNGLTSTADFPILREFQDIAWALNRPSLDQLPLKNDFEQLVSERHQELAAAVRKLRRLGAAPAMMTGSGSAVFGLFADVAGCRAAASSFDEGTAFPVRFVSRRQYRSFWRRRLGSAAAASCFGT